MQAIPDDDTPRLEARNLRGAVFRNVDLRLAAGECVALTGPSGSGKTVLLRALADLDPNHGEVMLDGVPRERFAPSAWRRALALLPAEPAWWGARVGEHFPEGDEPPLAALGLPPQALQWDVTRCSSGERQRLALLRALASEPRVLLLDEPTANLDADSRGRVEALIEEFLRGGGAALWVTHDPEQARRVARRRLHLLHGELRRDDPAAQEGARR